jgi:hypothetical protein
MWMGVVAFVRFNSWPIDLGAVPASHARMTMSGHIRLRARNLGVTVIRRPPRHSIRSRTRQKADEAGAPVRGIVNDKP